MGKTSERVMKNLKKVTLKVSSLESKVTPYCCPYPWECQGNLTYTGQQYFYFGAWGGMVETYDCSGKLAAVADY